MLCTVIKLLCMVAAPTQDVGNREAPVGAGVSITLQPNATEFAVGEPLQLLLVVSNDGATVVPTRFRNNRDLAGADHSVVFRRASEVVAKREHFEGNMIRGLGMRLPPGGDLRFELTIVPGKLGETFHPLPAGDYDVIARVGWGRRFLEAAPVRVRIRETASADIRHVNAGTVAAVEQPGALSVPVVREAVALLMEQAPRSPLAMHIKARQLEAEFRKLMASFRPLNSRSEWPPKIPELRAFASKLEEYLDDPNASRFFSPMLLHALARTQFELAGCVACRGDYGQDEMNAPVRAEYVEAWRQGTAAIKRLRAKFPESSYVQDVQLVAAGRAEVFRRGQQNRPRAPNAGVFREVLSMLEAVAE